MKRFIEILCEYLSLDIKDNKYAKSTLEKKGYQLDHFTIFIYKKGYQDISANCVRIRHMIEFKEWLRDNTTSETNEHISRHIRLVSNALDYAVCMDYAEYNPLLSMKLKKDPTKEVVIPDDEEVALFENYKSDRLLWQLAIDLYLFIIYTGVSYMDLWLFHIEKKRIFYDGQIITLSLITSISGRGKNGRLYWAEFIPKARGIWDKYDRQFPKIHVQTFNIIIQTVAKELGITKHLTTHTGRKKFANIKDDDGFSPAFITKMMGNTEKVLLKNYLKQNKKSLLIEMVRMKRRNMAA